MSLLSFCMIIVQDSKLRLRTKKKLKKNNDQKIIRKVDKYNKDKKNMKI